MTDTPLILTLDHNRRNVELLAQFLAKAGYRSLAATSLEEFDAVLAQAQTAALALVDLSGFDQHVWERCERLREAKIPFLVISAKQKAAVRQAGMARGASGVLVKPLVAKELLSFIRSLLEG